jgi:hypothetical protein
MSQNKAILSVLRSGGVYTPEYVKKLKYAVGNASQAGIRFICLTDVDFIDFCEVIPLKHNWPGWWSKIELFRPDLNVGKTTYFDLDVLILKDIEKLLALSDQLTFAMLRGWNTKHGIHPSSSIMCGQFSLYSHIYEKFSQDPFYHIQRMKRNVGAGMKGDQGFISEFVENVNFIQDRLPANYIIGKKMYEGNPELIKKAHVLSWSGEPRLHTVKKLWNYEVTNTVSDS